MRKIQSLILSACIVLTPAPSFGSPVTLRLDKQSSKVDFSFSSQLINTTGRFTDYDGVLVLDPESISNSKLELSADASGVSFGSLPIDQMFLVNSLIKSMPSSKVHFESNSFEQQSEGSFVVRGVASAGKNHDPVTLPITIIKSGSGKKVSGTFVRSGPIGNSKNVLSGMFGNAVCRGEFSLLFK